MVHDEAGFGALGVARVAVFGLWLGIVIGTPLHVIAELPANMRNPPGILAVLPASFWESFIAPGPLTLFRGGLVTLLVLVIGGGDAFRVARLPAAAGLLLFDGTLKSYGGFINHGQFAPLYCAILLSVAPSGEGLRIGFTRFAAPATLARALRLRGANPGSVLQLGGFLIAVPYALTGIHRLMVGGLSIFVDDSLPTYVTLRSLEWNALGFSLAGKVVESDGLVVLLRLGFFVVTLAEIASPSCCSIGARGVLG